MSSIPIPTSSQVAIEFTPEEFQNEEVKPIILIQHPTPLERETLNSRLLMMGLRAVSDEQIRVTMVDEVFQTDWGKGSPEANDAYADEVAALLDEVWQLDEVHNAAIERWQEQEAQRLFDEANGAPPRPPVAKPARVISLRKTAQAGAIQNELMQTSPRLLKLRSLNVNYAANSYDILFRISCVGVRNVAANMPIEVDPVTHALSDEAAQAVKNALQAAYGPQRFDKGWRQIQRFIDSLYRLAKDEEKNSDSPPEKPSPPNGSTGASDGSASSDGNSTESSIEPIPVSTSEPTTEASSTSASEPGAQ